MWSVPVKDDPMDSASQGNNFGVDSDYGGWSNGQCTFQMNCATGRWPNGQYLFKWTVLERTIVENTDSAFKCNPFGVDSACGRWSLMDNAFKWNPFGFVSARGRRSLMNSTFKGDPFEMDRAYMRRSLMDSTFKGDPFGVERSCRKRSLIKSAFKWTLLEWTVPVGGDP